VTHFRSEHIPAQTNFLRSNPFSDSLLVITADIPLAAEVVAKGALALNPRGELYTEENIRECLNMRDFMETLRTSGVDTGGPAAFSRADRQAFANRLDRLLANHGKSKSP
jgi:uncharacterized protein